MTNAWRLAFYELRRFRTPMQRLALGLLILLPVLFGVAYLGSTWDPYSRLDRVPVAIVNDDKPVTAGDVTIDGGKRLIANLTGTDTFAWQVTDAKSASDGLADGDYYLTVTVPADFSAKLASGPDEAPSRPTVVLRRDDANGFGVGNLTDRVRTDLKQQVDGAATATYYESVFGDVDSLYASAVTARKAAAKLRGSIDAAGNGSTELAIGLEDTASTGRDLVQQVEQLRTDSEDWVGSTAELADASSELIDEDAQLADDVLPAIPEIADSAAGVADLGAGLEPLLDGDFALAGQTEQLSEQLADLANDYPDLAADPDYTALVDAADGAASDAAEAAALAVELDDAASGLSSAASDLSYNADEVGQGLEDRGDDLEWMASTAQGVADSAGGLEDGLGTISDEAGRLARHVGNARENARAVNEEFQEFRGGADNVVERLISMTDRLPGMSEDQQATNAAILGSPTELRTVADHDARVDGRGIAPFLVAIALWIFGVVAFLLIRPITGRALAGRIGAGPIAVAGWLPAFALGLTGGLLLLLTALVLGLGPANIFASLLTVVIGAAVFTAITQFLRTWFGAIGTIAAVVLLLVQIISTAAVYPKETLPRLIELIHPLLPMTYLVRALRIAFTGGPADRLWVSLLVLVGFGAAAVLGTIVVVTAHRRWTPRRLRPVFTWPEPARG